MSIEILKSAFSEIKDCSNWSLQLLKINTSKSAGTKYASRQIQLVPDSEMSSFVDGISKKYLSSGKGSLESYTDITDYDGTASGTTIYRLHRGNTLIAAEYETFLTTIANPDVEADAFQYTSAYVLKGVVSKGDDSVPIKMVSMQSPITSLKQKYHLLHETGQFTQIKDPILTLRTSVDVVMIGDTIYFLTLAGENLFNMARAYKAVCHDAVTEVEETGILSNGDSFRAIAESGHNPRKFVSFDRARLDALKNTNTRKAMAKRFSIPLDAENRFDTTADGAADKIVKLLCNKGMVDPFKNIAVEVSGAKQWQ